MRQDLMQVQMPAFTTDLYFGEGLLQSGLLFRVCSTFSTKSVLITSQDIVSLSDPIVQSRGMDRLVIPADISTKSVTALEWLLVELMKKRCGRDTTLIAMGGGALTDLVGFAASIYLRGVKLIFIPTTLLAMVDAVIGGKTGIDTPYGKNLVGSYYPPYAILVDLDFLSTLPEKEWVNGLGEILKMGLIWDPILWKKVKENSRDREMIYQAIKHKMAIVKLDPFEKGLRRILNFGHTIGHGIEALSQYQLSHGFCVALGSLVEAHVSCQMGTLSLEDFREISLGFNAFSLKLPGCYTRDKLIDFLYQDKKNQQGEIRIVLLDRIGHVRESDGQYCEKIPLKSLVQSLEWMEKQYG